MADQNFIQRGLSGMREAVRPRETREARTEGGKSGKAEGDKQGVGSAVGRAAKGAVGKAKAGLGKLKKTLGFSGVDEMEPEDNDQQQRRRRARELLGDDEPSFAGIPQKDGRRDLSTVAPEFRAQVSSGLAAANSMTVGSTLVDGGKKDGGGERW
jgi:hypothetical protein